ncbi:MAG: glycosyltransferase family 4 protein [Phycisphaerales bacterium]
MSTRGDILIVQADQRTDHVPGLAEALAERGFGCVREDEAFATPRLPARARAVVVTDLVAPRCLRALRLAAGRGLRTALLLDGLTDFRNTMRNPRSPRGFLRPAPVDLVCCAGLSDAGVLRALGNRARPTGLPRIDAALPEALPSPGAPSLLIATANTPAFDAAERSALLEALRSLREAADRRRVPLVWRLTDGLDRELGVVTDTRPLPAVLAGVSAVVTTPSTLLVEAMRAGRATGVLHAHPTPLWHPAAWVWQPTDHASVQDERGVPAPPGGLTRWVDSADRLVQQLMRPTSEQRARQAECLRWLDASSGPVRSAELLAEAVSELASQPIGGEPRAVPRVERLPAPTPRPTDGRRRVVGIVSFDDTPLGGVTLISQRLASALAARPDLGYDMRTLLIAWDSPNAWKADRLLDERTSLCVVDRTEPAHRILEHIRRAVERLEPELVLPNHTDAPAMVASQLRYAGVPCVAQGHTDDDYYRELLLQTEWDGAAAGCEAIAAWLEPLAGDRPFATIVQGVPTRAEPRPVPDEGPLELAYIGRIVEPQKRVTEFVPMLRRLEALGVPTRMHFVGEGAALPTLRQALAAERFACVEVCFHGWQSEAWVAAFLPRIDASVLLSDTEGSCLAMLEAMGAGVVPAMTDVPSGARAWVEDGVSGVMAPMGQPERMADRLAWLAEDRARIRTLSAEAHTRIARTQTLERAAEQYAALFDAVLSRPVQTEPGTIGLTVLEPSRWADAAEDDREGEIAWATDWLREAGFASVGVGAAAPGDDAVYVPVGDAGPVSVPPGVRLVRTGVGGCRNELVPHVRAMMAQGCQRIAVFGNGPHTHRRRGVFDDPSLPIVGIIDDHPPATGASFGLPVVTPEHALDKLRIDGVLLSSDNWEARLFERCRPLREAGVVVRGLYTAARDGLGASASARAP